MLEMLRIATEHLVGRGALGIAGSGAVCAPAGWQWFYFSSQSGEAAVQA